MDTLTITNLPLIPYKFLFQDLREIRRESACQELAILKKETGNTTDRKRDILTVTDTSKLT